MENTEETVFLILCFIPSQITDRVAVFKIAKSSNRDTPWVIFGTTNVDFFAQRRNDGLAFTSCQVGEASHRTDLTDRAIEFAQRNTALRARFKFSVTAAAMLCVERLAVKSVGRSHCRVAKA